MKQHLPDYIHAGVTGTGGAPQSINLKEFRMLCHTAARLTGGKVLGFDLPPFHTSKNFVLAALQFSDPSGERLVFLLKHHASLLACASAQDLTFHFPFAFIDFPELTAPFQPFFHILKRQELECPWMWTERELASRLHPQEIKEIIYWKPHTVGEAIFNFWD